MRGFCFLILFSLLCGCQNSDNPKSVETQESKGLEKPKVVEKVDRVTSENYLKINEDLQTDEIKMILGPPSRVKKFGIDLEYWYWDGPEDKLIGIYFAGGKYKRKFSENLIPK